VCGRGDVSGLGTPSTYTHSDFLALCGDPRHSGERPALDRALDRA
jgi:hypothetical protein